MGFEKLMGSLIIPDDFTHVIRLLNSNVDGKEKTIYALTNIRGIGRRFADLVCKKGEMNLAKRAGELSVEQLEKLMEIVANPQAYKIPRWYVNNQNDYKHGEYSQITVDQIDSHMRDNLERLKKIRSHRGIRHFWGVRVRGQHTKTTGRGCKNVGAKFKTKK